MATMLKQSERLAALTSRELETLEQVRRGLSYREIASALELSVNTVRSRMQSLYRKLDVRTAHEAVTLVFPGQPNHSTKRERSKGSGRPPNRNLEAALSLLEQGHTRRQIAKQLGVHPSTVTRMLQGVVEGASQHDASPTGTAPRSFEQLAEQRLREHLIAELRRCFERSPDTQLGELAALEGDKRYGKLLSRVTLADLFPELTSRRSSRA